MYQIKTDRRYITELILAGLVGALAIAMGVWLQPLSTLILWITG